MALRLANDPDDAPIERSLTVGQAAELLSASTTWVRRALRRGDLAGHQLGRAVRVYAWSIEAYRQRHATTPADAPAPAPRRQVRTAAFSEAIASLARKGIVF